MKFKVGELLTDKGKSPYKDDDDYYPSLYYVKEIKKYRNRIPSYILESEFDSSTVFTSCLRDYRKANNEDIKKCIYCVLRRFIVANYERGL